MLLGTLCSIPPTDRFGRSMNTQKTGLQISNAGVRKIWIRFRSRKPADRLNGSTKLSRMSFTEYCSGRKYVTIVSLYNRILTSILRRTTMILFIRKSGVWKKPKAPEDYRATDGGVPRKTSTINSSLVRAPGSADRVLHST